MRFFPAPHCTGPLGDKRMDSTNLLELFPRSGEMRVLMLHSVTLFNLHETLSPTLHVREEDVKPWTTGP